MLVASVNEEDEDDPPRVVHIEERQRLKDLEDQVIDVISVLHSTNDTIHSLLEKYEYFCCDVVGEDRMTDDRRRDHIDIALRERQKDVVLNLKKLQALHTKIRSTTKLVSLSNSHYIDA